MLISANIANGGDGGDFGQNWKEVIRLYV